MHPEVHQFEFFNLQQEFELVGSRAESMASSECRSACSCHQQQRRQACMRVDVRQVVAVFANSFARPPQHPGLQEGSQPGGDLPWC